MGKDTIVRVTGWLRGIWEMRRRTGPVQRWVDSIPSPIKSNLAIVNERQGASTEVATLVTPSEPKDIPFSMETKSATMTASAPINVPNVPVINTPGLPRYHLRKSIVLSNFVTRVNAYSFAARYPTNWYVIQVYSPIAVIAAVWRVC